MTIPSSGGFSVATVNTDMSRTSTDPLTLGSDAFRVLCRKLTGALSMNDARGRSASGRYVSPALTRPTAGISAGTGYDDGMAITPDGTTIVLANSYDQKFSVPSWRGAVYVFKYNKSTDTWTGPTVVGDTQGVNSFGSRKQSVSINSAGTRIVVGAVDYGLTIFDWNGSTWVRSYFAKPSGASYFGHAISLSDDGNTVAVGAYLETGNPSTYYQGAVYIYIWTGSAWTLQQKLKNTGVITYSYTFGDAVSLSSDGNTLFVHDFQDRCGTASIKGASYVYTRTSGVWTQQSYIPTYPDNVQSATLWGCRNGLEYALRCFGDGIVIYRKVSSTWTKVQTISAPPTTPTASNFGGNSISFSDDGKFMLVVDYYESGSRVHSYAKDLAGNWFYQGTFASLSQVFGNGRINSDGTIGALHSGGWGTFAGYIFDK